MWMAPVLKRIAYIFQVFQLQTKILLVILAYLIVFFHFG